MKSYQIDKFKICLLNVNEIPDDALERISGYHCFSGEGEVIYNTMVFHKILNDPEDDTNATTKYRIEDLYERIKDCAYFQIATT